MIKDINSEILYNEQTSKEYYKLGLKTGWANFTPGQFVMVQVPDGVVFLRRPFSICRKIEKDSIELFYKKIGSGTARLSDLSQGDVVNVLGPLGKGFEIPKSTKKAVMIAGGFGVAPFVELSAHLKKKKVQADLYYGGKGLEDIQFLEEFEDLGVNIHISTEDGSLGHKGLITELLLKDIASHSCEGRNLDPCLRRDDSTSRRDDSTSRRDDTMIFCCGPEGMTEAVVNLAQEQGMSAQVSYETYMGCGIGVCLGCAVKTKEGYKRACKEGPVFNIEEII